MPTPPTQGFPLPGRLRRHAVGAMALMATALAAGCEGDRISSSLHPAGPAAEKIAWLWWFIFVVCTIVFIVTMLLLLVAMIRRGRDGKPLPPLGNGFIIVSGIIIPTIILLVIMFASLHVTVGLRPPPADLTIQVIGHRWWWEVRYPDYGITTANELHIPAGRNVRLELWSNDVVHSFWVPRLHGKMDMLPDVVNEFWIKSSEPGVFRGQCAEYCGLQHARMAMYVIALPPEEFDQWAMQRVEPPPPPQEIKLQRGQQVFTAAGCASCHAIAGTEAVARQAPDLTHIGSRRSLGAGTVPNNTGNLAGWITNPQPIKPGNLMPRSYLESDDLHALVAYLQSLK